MRGEVYGSASGRRRATAVQAVCAGQGSTVDTGKIRGGAHLKHAAHFCDAGGVQAQRLVERPRALRRVETRAYNAGRGSEAGRQERVWSAATA